MTIQSSLKRLQTTNCKQDITLSKLFKVFQSQRYPHALSPKGFRLGASLLHIKHNTVFFIVVTDPMSLGKFLLLFSFYIWRRSLWYLEGIYLFFGVLITGQNCTPPFEEFLVKKLASRSHFMEIFPQAPHCEALSMLIYIKFRF